MSQPLAFVWTGSWRAACHALADALWAGYRYSPYSFYRFLELTSAPMRLNNSRYERISSFAHYLTPGVY
jgi:hypothetical protein